MGMQNHRFRRGSFEEKKSLGENPKDRLKEVVFQFLLNQSKSLPILDVKQSIEKDWSISKPDYEYKWKLFLESIECVSIETKIQLNGKPLDFVFIDQQKMNESHDVGN